ncbi:hypothetical protein CEP48_05210 [Mergibacter septicus]|uniref:Uncharacterized protein n=1 Tax=Mergibacter septicus TaxID=221402 RepID=A0A8E3MGF9_9PAST|nr:phage holin family protein [Mergibacter septicus]AWX15607.1 hypothetical protein CEP47_05210 [Mergibacter septicus]QDJ13085.1 hypothetical protein CEP45_04120 [Mergibacter septicus]QDJ14861.1 hypothetical protein CEP48_05210 [Mergibacter septicus]UTU47711.1 hypothetical protein HLL31_02370 [Mergibacter septicus]WMR96682.1 phage holin family protein [Mergibacter septicus]
MDTSKLSYFGAILSFFCGLSLHEWGSLIGIFLGVGTFMIHWYYKKQDLKLKKIALKKGILKIDET